MCIPNCTGTHLPSGVVRKKNVLNKECSLQKYLLMGQGYEGEAGIYIYTEEVETRKKGMRNSKAAVGKLEVMNRQIWETM